MFFSNGGNYPDRLFCKGSLSDVLNTKKILLKKKIESEEDRYILQVDSEKYCDYLYNEFKIEPVNIDKENIRATSEEKKESLIQFNEPIIMNVMIINCIIPFSGDPIVLEYCPDRFTLNPPLGKVSGNNIYIQIRADKNNPQATSYKYDNIIEEIKEYVNYGNKMIDKYNEQLNSDIKRLFNNKKQQILQNRKFLSTLDIPIIEDKTVSNTFTIPTPKIREKIEITKPEMKNSLQEPEPTLSNSVYQRILNLINDAGKEFERLPNVYGGKEEENLRDHILMILEPHFSGSATGETFNKNGKTDILLRYDGTNVFIGECKFWKGEKHYLDTITQLINYLTWRDSKASVIIFDKQKNFSNAFDHIVEITKRHPNYVEYIGKTDASWFNFIFHINGDKNKKIQMATMLYHIPQ